MNLTSWASRIRGITPGWHAPLCSADSSAYTHGPDRPPDGCRWSGAAAKSVINMELEDNVRPASPPKEQ